MVQWFILYKRTQKVRGSIPTEVLFPLVLGGKGKKSGENNGKKTLDQGSEVELTTILRSIYEPLFIEMCTGSIFEKPKTG